MINNKFGLKKEYIKIIQNTLINYPEISEAKIFGSRAKGNYKNGSDVDIVLIGKKVNDEIVQKISQYLNQETEMPYFFDVLNFNSINNNDLKKHIERVGKEIFKR